MPPEAAVAVAITGSRALLNWEIPSTVSRPRPIRASRSPADTAVIHRAPLTVMHRPTVPRRSGTILSTAPRTTTPHIRAATLFTPASR